MTLKDIFWVAGLTEGEAAFCRSSKGYLRISVSMTDQDIVQRLADLWGSTVTGPYQPKGKPSYKPQFRTVVTGKRAVGWMLTIFSVLGKRRQAKITELLASDKTKFGTGLFTKRADRWASVVKK